MPGKSFQELAAVTSNETLSDSVEAITIGVLVPRPLLTGGSIDEAAKKVFMSIFNCTPA